jgi:hypothetical protein
METNLFSTPFSHIYCGMFFSLVVPCEARSLRPHSNPLVSNDTKSSRTDELLIVDNIAPSNATHFVQPLGYAEAIDR